MDLPLPRGTARLAAVLDALPDGLVLVDHDGTVVHANTRAHRMFTAPGIPLAGRPLRGMLPSFDPRPGGAGTDRRSVPARTTARRTDGGAFPVEVTRTGLAPEDATGAHDALLVLVVRDLTGTLDTEAELARSQRQTEMILRAAAEGVVGTDTDGRVVLVNPAFAQILGYRADELDGAELHPLILAKRADGTPFPYEDSPLADTLKSGRKHRVRGQVLWSKAGERVPVDLTTAPVRDGDQLVGAVMTFTDRRPHEELVEKHAAELADRAERHAAEREEQAERYAALAARHARLTAALAASRHEAPEPAAAGDPGPRPPEPLPALARHPTTLGTLVNSGIDKSAALTGPHRTRFAVHAPPVVVTLDPVRASTALAHLIADASGVTSSGAARPHGPAASPADTTVVITAAVRGADLRIEICGPRAVDDPAHLAVARGIVEAHGGVLTSRAHAEGVGLTHVVRIPHTPAPAPVPAARRAPVPREFRAPVAGSWIIGAAVEARRDRVAAVPSPLPTPSAGRSRPYVVPLPHPPLEPPVPRREPLPPYPLGGVRRTPEPAPSDDAAQERIVRLLARIRRHSA